MIINFTSTKNVCEAATCYDILHIDDENMNQLFMVGHTSGSNCN